MKANQADLKYFEKVFSQYFFIKYNPQMNETQYKCAS